MIKKNYIKNNTLYLNYGLKRIKFGKIGKNVRIDTNNSHSFFGNSSNIYIGDNVFIGRNTYIDAVSEVNIGSGVMIGPNCTFIGGDHNYNSNNLKSIPYDNVIIDKNIIVKENVWIAANVMVCPGTQIGEGAVIAAGTCIYGEIHEYSVITSKGYRIVKERSAEQYKLLKEKGAIFNEKFAGKGFQIKRRDNEGCI